MSEGGSAIDDGLKVAASIVVREAPTNRGRQVRRLISDTAETAIAFAVKATNSLPHSKILPLGAFAALLVVLAVPLLSQADMPSASANSTLKCYDNAGNDEPCVTRASASSSRSEGRTTGTRPVSWLATALYQKTSWAASSVDPPTNSTPSSSVGPRSSGQRIRPASTACRRRVIPCVFSALRRGVAHLVAVAAIEAQARRPSERL